MQILIALFLLLLLQHEKAVARQITCNNNDDCNEGETCVAGDSRISVQSCMTGAACSGSMSGSCPSDVVNGPLACIQHDGIYKCMSIDRCDEYFGDSFCSDGCNVNGVQCNGQGTCSVVSTTSDGAQHFGCMCNDGFSGDTCDVEVSSRSNSQDISSASGSMSVSSSVSSSVNNSLNSFPSPPTTVLNDEDSNNVARAAPQSDGSEATADDSDSGGSSSTVFIVIGILAACVIVGALIFAMYSRKRKREQEVEAGGVGGSAALGASAMGERAIFKGTEADTPKSCIVTM